MTYEDCMESESLGSRSAFTSNFLSTIGGDSTGRRVMFISSRDRTRGQDTRSLEMCKCVSIKPPSEVLLLERRGLQFETALWPLAVR